VYVAYWEIHWDRKRNIWSFAKICFVFLFFFFFKKKASFAPGGWSIEDKTHKSDWGKGKGKEGKAGGALFCMIDITTNKP